MNYFFRADGNAKIGMGHIMRCMTIAKELKSIMEEDDSLVFICADEGSAEVVKSNDIDAIVLGSNPMDMPGEFDALRRKVSDLTSAVAKENNVFLVDSYQVTDEYLISLGELGTVYLMDDMQEHKYPVNGVINYNAYADPDKYRELYWKSEVSLGDKTELYVGSRFIPVRSEFLTCEYKVKRDVTNVLITTGGGDVDNIAGEIAKELLRIAGITANREDSVGSICFHIVAGGFNPNIGELKKLESLYPDNIELHVNVKDMAELMGQCDIAITAGGSTMYELCAVGVPFICFTYAENQVLGAEYMNDHGVAEDAGAYHKKDKLTIENIGRIFKQYCEYYDIRLGHSDMGRRIVDGKGASRIARVLNKNK